MLARLNEAGFVPSLDESASSAVTGVELLDVLRRQELHAQRERGLRCLDEQVHVVGHMAVRVQLPPSALRGDSQKSIERQMVYRIDEEDLVARRPLRDVEDTIRDVDAGRARHAPNIAAKRRHE